MISISLNGTHAHTHATTIATLVQERVGEHARGVAVARNAELVPRNAWADTSIQQGDRIELVRATQGG